ncbi:MAG: MFS transporter, partial [Solimonas sp.]
MSDAPALPAPGAAARRRWQPRPEGYAALLMLGLIGSAGMFVANILPVLIAALREGLAYSARDAGFVGAANVYGTAIGGAVGALLMRRLPWRRTIAAALLALLALDLLSCFVPGFAALCALRFAHGLIGGLSVGFAFGVIGRTPDPDRAFGMLILVQFGLAGLCVMILPRLIAPFGAGAAYLGLAAISMLALLVLPLIPDYAPRPSAAGAPAARLRLSAGLLLAFASLFLFQATKSSLYSYIFGLGQWLRLDAGFLSTVLGIAAWSGALGALLVTVIGRRYGRLRPLGVVLPLTLAAYFALLTAGTVPAVFAVSELVTVVAWAFIAPYLFGLCAAFD